MGPRTRQVPKASPLLVFSWPTYFSGGAMYWTIRLRQDERFVGVCDLSEIHTGQSTDVGFMFLREFWGVLRK
jgi:RimJ/RimL family protein N-acetyltransferase